MIYIASLEIEGICCFKDLSKIDFQIANNIAETAIILGNNGTGKTTILRSIALGLCDPSSSTGLMQELYGDMISSEKDTGLVRINFMSNDKNVKAPCIESTLSRTDSGNIKVEQKTYPEENFPWDDIFVCGYGAARSAYGTIDIREYSIVDSVYTLFNYDSKLQNAELILRRIKDIDTNAQEILKKMLNRIDHILMLPEGSSQLGKEGITVSGPWGQFMPHGVLGDGYRAVVALISDLLGWALFYDETMFFKEIKGIVLIDEIEQHLHPDWQRKIVRLLNVQFPKIQFIITTHSPLVAANSNRLSEDDFNSKLFSLKREETFSQISEVEENLGELDFDQILSSEAFDHIFNINPRLAGVLREASILAAKDNRTDKEENKLNKFKNTLKEIMFPKGRTLVERIVERDYYRELEKKVEEFNKIINE